MKIESLLAFLQEADRLKAVDRQTLVHNGGRRENSAEHSWHLALAVIAFHSEAQEKIQLEKALKMALLHDLVEIDAGDTFVYDETSSKKTLEAAAAERIFGILPEPQCTEFRAIWQEFEERKSPEARYVAALDRFLPLFSNHLNQGYSWRNHKITKQQVLAKNGPPIKEGLPSLWPAAEKMVIEAEQKGYL